MGGTQSAQKCSADIRLYNTAYYPGNMLSGLATLTFPFTDTENPDVDSVSSPSVGNLPLAGRLRIVGVETVSTGPKVAFGSGGMASMLLMSTSSHNTSSSGRSISSAGTSHNNAQNTVHQNTFYEETLTLFGDPPKGSAKHKQQQKETAEGNVAATSNANSIQKEQQPFGKKKENSIQKRKGGQQQTGHFKYPFAFHLPRYLPPSTALWASGASSATPTGRPVAGKMNSFDEDLVDGFASTMGQQSDQSSKTTSPSSVAAQNDRGVAVEYFIEVRLKKSATETLTFRRGFHLVVPIDKCMLKPIPRMTVGRTVQKKIPFLSSATTYVRPPSFTTSSHDQRSTCHAFLCRYGGDDNENDDHMMKSSGIDGKADDVIGGDKSGIRGRHHLSNGFVDVSLSSTRKFFVPGDSLEGELIIDNNEGLVLIDSMAIELHARADLVFPYTARGHSLSASPSSQTAAVPKAVGLSRYGGAVYGPSTVNMVLGCHVPPGETISVPLVVPIPNVINTPSYPAKGSCYYLRHELSIKLSHTQEALYLPIHIAGGSVGSNAPAAEKESEVVERSLFKFIPNDQCCASLTAKSHGRRHYAYCVNSNNSSLLNPSARVTETDVQPHSSSGAVLPFTHSDCLRPLPEYLPTQPEVPKSAIITLYP